jgi:rare lipoprotein A
MRNHSSRLKNLRIKMIRHTQAVPLALAALAALSFQTLTVSPAGAKTPGSTYCYYGTCHRVKSIAETEAMIGQEETLVASHYDSCKKDRYNPCGLTSSGEAFNPETDDTAASPIYPDGTKLLVWSPETSVAIVLRINNAGPYWGNRKLDVARGAAERLGFAGEGIATLKVRVLSAPTVEEATYKKNRTYPPVPGYIGRFASTESAQVAMASVNALETLAGFVGVPAKGETMNVARAGMIGAEQAPVSVASAEPVTEAPKVATVAREKPVFAKPLQVAALDAPKPEILSPAVSHVALREEHRQARVKPRAERVASRSRPNRATRVAMARSRPGNRNRIVTAGYAPRPALGSRPVTSDGTNDSLSVFSRHGRPEMPATFSQNQAEERSRKQAYRSRQTASLHRGRDRGDS